MTSDHAALFLVMAAMVAACAALQRGIAWILQGDDDA